MSQTETDGRKLRGARSRAAILEQAMNIASVEGLEGLTFGRLASELSISKGNITVLFGDREAVQIATLDAAVDVFVREIITPNLAVRSAFTRLQAVCDGWFSYVDRRVFPGGCLMHALSNEYRARPGAIQDRVRYHRDSWRRFLEGLVRAARDEGRIKALTDPKQIVFELLAFQSAANVGALIGDKASFSRARATSRSRIAESRL